MIKRILLFAFLFSLWTWACPSAHAQYHPVAGVVDLRTIFSDGSHDVGGIADLAHGRGLKILILTDHDRMAMEYGIPPFRNILKVKVEENSINVQGAGKYLQAIEETQRKYPDMILIPGSETAPFYYWTGYPLPGQLTSNNPERRLLTIGMEKPGDYENLPILHNGPPLLSNKRLLPGIFFLIVSLVLSIIMLRWRGLFRVTGILIAFLSIAVFLNSVMSGGTSPFDAYHGDRGIAPYQLAIDYVNSKGGLIFWNYPETKSGVRKMGPIRVNTPPYPGVLEDSRGYTGFSALYGDNATITEPGSIWDLTLKEYCKGLRERPPWGIATSDFHLEGEAGQKLGDFQTVFFLREMTKAEALDALRKGRIYAASGKFPLVPRLDDFSVTGSRGEATAISGEEIALRENPIVRVSLSMEGSSPAPVRVRLIRSGEVIKIIESPLPIRIVHQDEYLRPGEKIYYRLDMRGAGVVVSNPIFVKFTSD